jgi:xylulokinase
MKAKSHSFLIGIDVGTTSIKGILMDHTGEPVAFSKQEYTLESGEGDRCELDPEIYWIVTCRIIRDLLYRSGTDPSLVTGVSFSSQGETLIPVDHMGRPLRKAIVWLDNRSSEEAVLIKDRFGGPKVMEITGQPEILPTWPATKILWISKNEPDVFQKAGKYLLVEDFLIFRMTGKYCTEYSVSSSTLYLNISQKGWWQEMLDFIGISEKQLPELLPSGKAVGNLTPEAAAATGLNTEVLCVTGSYDHPAGAIGSGNIRSGDVTLTIGASMAMCVAIDKPVSDLSLRLPCQCHSVDGLYFLQPYGQTAGMVLKWFKDGFCQEEVNEAAQKNEDPYDRMVRLAEKVRPGADGLVMLPHLMGTGSPEFNPKVKGVFAGIGLGMGKGHFIRAIIESVCLMIHHNLVVIRENGFEVKTIHILGGAAKSRLWNQVLADVTGLPVCTLLQNENAALGACMLAGTGTGIFPDLKTACEASVRKGRQYEPNLPNHQVYTGLYEKYRYLYSALEYYWEL